MCSYARSSVALGFHAFFPIMMVYFKMFLGLISHKNESLDTLLRSCMSYKALGDFLDIGCDFVLLTCM